MSVLRVLAVLLLAASGVSVGAAKESSMQPQTELTRALDELCRFTGLRRPQPAKIDRVVSADAGYVAYLDLIVDGATKPYRVSLNSQHHITRFMPEQFDFGNVGLGYDTLKNSELRKMCLRAVQRVNQNLKWKWVTGPQMQRVGADFVVSFETVSDAEQSASDEVVFLDPYVSFLITPKGTVFGGFWGA